MRTLTVLCALVAAIYAHQANYSGFKVYRIQPKNVDQVKILVELDDNEYVDFWSPLRYNGGPIDVMVNPLGQATFEWFLINKHLKFEVIIENVDRIVQQERMHQMLAPRSKQGRISFNKYNNHREINAYLNQLAKDYPNTVTVETIGHSYEGREMNLIKIAKKSKTAKPAIFIDAGIHAREWAAPAQATYIINQLVENPANSHLLDKVDWHILPVVNPDGYEHTHAGERFWRKTRSKGNRCYGTDANRNFGFHWGETGASSWECSDTYKGTVAFSEVETQAVRDYLWKHKDVFKLYLTFHSYGNYLLYPWGFTSALPDDADELQSLGEAVANAIYSVNGAEYTIGSSTNVLYAAAGGSDDWAKGVAGIELAYTVELPGGGSNGFDLPPHRILSVVEETWEGCKIYHDHIARKFGN